MAHQKHLKYLTFFVWMGLVLGDTVAWAREDVVPGSRYTSGRVAAMGDAGLPVGEGGADGLFYNPAILGKIKSPQLEVGNVQLNLNSGFLNKFDNDFYKATDLTSYSPKLQTSPGVFQGVGGAFAPNYSMKFLAFGLLLEEQVGATYNPDGTTRVRSQYQLIPAVGTGFRLAGGIVRVGYSFQWVNKAEGDVNSIAAGGYNQSITEGAGFSHNAGFALTLPIRYLPALNIVARNIAGVRYTMDPLYHFANGPSGRPADESMSIDTSISSAYKAGGGSYFTLVAEGRDLTNTSSTSLLNRLTFGAEYALKDAFFLRGGFGGLSPSAGIGFKQKGGEFALSWYTVDIGTSATADRDHRFLLHYTAGAF